MQQGDALSVNEISVDSLFFRGRAEYASNAPYPYHFLNVDGSRHVVFDAQVDHTKLLVVIVKNF